MAKHTETTDVVNLARKLYGKIGPNLISKGGSIYKNKVKEFNHGNEETDSDSDEYYETKP